MVSCGWACINATKRSTGNMSPVPRRPPSRYDTAQFCQAKKISQDLPRSTCSDGNTTSSHGRRCHLVKYQVSGSSLTRTRAEAYCSDPQSFPANVRLTCEEEHRWWTPQLLGQLKVCGSCALYHSKTAVVETYRRSRRTPLHRPVAPFSWPLAPLPPG